jgi:hypothetical protein
LEEEAEMTRILSALSLAMLSVAVVWPATSASAGDTPTARVESTADVSAPMASNGTVKAIAAGKLTIVGSSGGGARFTQTFIIDSDTAVIGRGAGTKAAANGGRVSLTDFVASGDQVRVSYRKASGGALHATDVRVMLKAKK